MSAAKKPTKRELDGYEKLLRAALNGVAGDIDHLQKETLEAEGGREESTEEGSSDVYALEISLGLLEQDESTARDILDALEKVKLGTFGACEECEEWIAKERLEALPHARLCIACQRANESGNGRA